MLGLASLLLVAAASPPQVSVHAAASKTEVTVGEPFTLDLKATGPAGTTYTFPAGAATDAFEVGTPEGSQPTPTTAPEPGTHRYRAAVFTLGDAQIPPIPVRYRLPDGSQGEASSEAVSLKVVSLLPKDPQEQKLADVRGPQPVTIGRAFWIALGLALLLLALLVTWLVRRKRRAQTPVVAAAPPVPADVQALRALDTLAASGLLDRGELRAFYIELTAIAKTYLERRLEAPILEMTTTETLAFLRNSAHGGDLLPLARDLSGAADRIKFARGEGLREEAERHLAAVRSLVPALEARLRPAQPETPADGKAA